MLKSSDLSQGRRKSRRILTQAVCYSDFTNEEHIQRLTNRALVTKLDEAIPEPPASATRRSSLDPVDWKKSIFCRTDLKTVASNQIQTFETRILKNGEAALRYLLTEPNQQLHAGMNHVMMS